MKVSDLGAASGPDVLWHPLVLKGAWMRVEDWYRSGNLAPEPELSRWRLHPEAGLRKLGSALRKRTSRPTRWPQVPYPILGADARHEAGPEPAPVTESLTAWSTPSPPWIPAEYVINSR